MRIGERRDRQFFAILRLYLENPPPWAAVGI
jgi:hypothetical protein